MPPVSQTPTSDDADRRASLGATRTTAARSTGLTKTYGQGDTEVVALDGIDVAFAAGQFTAIMGPSGSGKSTLMHWMAGRDALRRRTVERRPDGGPAAPRRRLA